MIRLLFLALFSLSALAPASAEILTVTHFSEALQRNQTYRAYVPDDASEENRYPVMYLLHGAAVENQNTWLNNTPIATLAQQYRMIIVFPFGGLYGWYLDSPVEPLSQYETYITRELIADVDARLPTIAARSSRAIMGNSMGGHGAMSLSAKNPHLFGSASSTAGILRLQNHYWKWQIPNRLGPLNQFPERWTEHSVYDLAWRFRFNSVRIMFDCGAQDSLGATLDNRQLHELLNDLDVPHTYNEANGDHNWPYWRSVIQNHLAFHQGVIDEAKNAEPPSGYSPSWFLAEGATHPGFDTFVLIANPNPLPISVHIDFLTEGGANASIDMPIAARSRVTVKANDYVPNMAVSMVLNEKAGLPFAVERAMYSTGAAGWYGGHAALAVPKARSSWFLPEGSSATAGPAERPFKTFLLMANPESEPVDVMITFYVEGGPTFDRFETIPMHSRRTILCNESYDERLAEVAFSTRVNAAAGHNVIVERAMWWNASNWTGGSFMEGNASPGLTDLSNQWYLAEGNSEDFDNFILIVNPNPNDVWVEIKYLLEGAEPQARKFLIPANQRKTINVRWDEEGLGFGTCHGVVVFASLPVAVERSMYHSEAGIGWLAAHNGLASPRAAYAWAFPEGATVPISVGNLRTEILIANPQPSAAAVTLLFLLDDGTNFELQRTVPASQRITVIANDIPELQERAFSTIVVADQAIVAERSMYWGMNSPVVAEVAGGTNSIGIPLAYTTQQLDALDMRSTAAVFAPFAEQPTPTQTPTPTLTPTPSR